MTCNDYQLISWSFLIPRKCFCMLKLTTSMAELTSWLPSFVDHQTPVWSLEGQEARCSKQQQRTCEHGSITQHSDVTCSGTASHYYLLELGRYEMQSTWVTNHLLKGSVTTHLFLFDYLHCPTDQLQLLNFQHLSTTSEQTRHAFW